MRLVCYLINRLEIVLTVSSPSPTLSPKTGGDWGERIYVSDNYETLKTINASGWASM
jgi:hypothetical protein